MVTPSSRRIARAGAVLVALATAGAIGVACDDKKPPVPAPPAASVSPASPASVMALLGLDAGGLGETTDPPAPPGDLKSELDRFVSVDTCVKERANIDPLVGDALRAIGYDTFLRDACRLLEAAKDHSREKCDRIDSSALRSRCQSWVAMVAQTPDTCPLQFEGIPTRGRNVTCLAVAGKDPRLCTGEPRTAVRATCEAHGPAGRRSLRRAPPERHALVQARARSLAHAPRAAAQRPRQAARSARKAHREGRGRDARPAHDRRPTSRPSSHAAASS